MPEPRATRQFAQRRRLSFRFANLSCCASFRCEVRAALALLHFRAGPVGIPSQKPDRAVRQTHLNVQDQTSRFLSPLPEGAFPPREFEPTGHHRMRVQPFRCRRLAAGYAIADRFRRRDRFDLKARRACERAEREQHREHQCTTPTHVPMVAFAVVNAQYQPAGISAFSEWTAPTTLAAGSLS